MHDNQDINEDLRKFLHQLDFETRKAEELYRIHLNKYWVTKNFETLLGVATAFAAGMVVSLGLYIASKDFSFTNPYAIAMMVSAVMSISILYAAEKKSRHIRMTFKNRHLMEYILLRKVNKAP